MRILLTGATGLVGQGVLNECLRDPSVAQVVALVRHPTGESSPKYAEIVVADFGDLSTVETHLHPFDACLYCAGVLVPGMAEADYRHVTLDLTLHVARTLMQHNPQLTFVYISGAGSDPRSRLMPLRVKGETERALAALPMRTILLRPGIIQPVDGIRSPHSGLALFYGLANPLMGVGVRMAPRLMTTTAHVGRAMLRLLHEADPQAIVENDEINQLGSAG